MGVMKKSNGIGATIACAISIAIVIHGVMTDLIYASKTTNIISLILLIVAFVVMTLKFSGKLVRKIKYSRIYVVISVIVAIAITTFCPLVPSTSPFIKQTEIIIEANGMKGPESNASEIWFKGLFIPGRESIAPSQFNSSGDWSNVDGVYLSRSEGSNALSWKGRLNDSGYLKFTSHAWSGIAKVTVDGETQTRNLYAPDNLGDELINVSQKSNTGSPVYKSIFLISLSIVVFFIVYVLLLMLPIRPRAYTAVFILCSSLSLVLSSFNYFYGEVRFIGFFSNYEDGKLHYSTGYGFNSDQVVDVNYQAPLMMDLQGLEGNSPLSIKLKESQYSKVVDVFHFNSLLRNEDGDVLASSSEPISVYGISNIEAVHTISIGNSIILEHTDIGQRTGEAFLLVDLSKGIVGLSSLDYTFSRWQLDGENIEKIGIASSDSSGTIVQLNPSQDHGVFSDAAFYGSANIENGLLTFAGESLKDVEPAHRVTQKYLAALFAGVIGIVLLALIQIRKEIMARLDRTAILVVLLISTYFLVHLAGYWPGVIISDTMSPIVQYVSASYNTWYGIGIPLYTAIMRQFGPWGLDIALQNLLYVALFSFVFVYALRNKVPRFMVGLTMLYMFMFSFAGYASVYRYRDSLSAVLICIVLVTTWLLLRHKLQISNYKAAIVETGLFGLLYASYLLRVDNVIIVVGILLSLFLFYKKSIRRLVLLSVVLIIAMGSTAYSTTKLPSYPAENPWYRATAIINPIGAVMSKPDYKSNNKSEDREIIGRIMDPDALINNWTPLHIGYWHDTQRLETTDQTAVEELQRLYIRLIKDNPIYFIEGRMDTFLSAMTTKSILNGDYDLINSASKQLKDYNIKRQEHSVLLKSLHVFYMFLKKYVVTVPQLAIALVAVCLFRFTPMTSIVSLCMLLKTGALFVLAPTSFLSYHFDLHLFGVILPFLMIIEWKQHSRKLTEEIRWAVE
jgi:hypothetical protein